MQVTKYKQKEPAKRKHLLLQTAVTKTVIGIWHCPHSTQSRIYEMVQCPSVRLSHLTAAATCGGFVATGWQVGDISRLPAPQQQTATG